MLVYIWVPRNFRNCKAVHFLPPQANSSTGSAAGVSPRRPPLWAAYPRHLLLALASTRRAEAPHRSTPRAVPSPRLATRSEDCRRPPPRRRRGWPTAAPQSPIPRAPEHYKHPRKLFLSFFRSFPLPRPQSAAAIHLNAGKLDAAANPPFQTRSAPTDPAISTTRVLRISQVPPPPQSAAAKRSPASYPSRRRTSPRGTPNPTTLSPKKTTIGFVSASSSFPPTQPSPPVS